MEWVKTETAREWPTEDKDEFRKYLESEKMLEKRAFYDIMMALRIYKRGRILSMERTGEYSYVFFVLYGDNIWNTKDMVIEDIRPFYRGCARDLLGFKRSWLRDRAYARDTFEMMVEMDRDYVMAAAWYIVRELAIKGVRVTKSVLNSILVEVKKDDPEIFFESAQDGRFPTIERNFFMYGSIPIPFEAEPRHDVYLDHGHYCLILAHVWRWAGRAAAEGKAGTHKETG